MMYGDFKGLPRRAESDKVLRYKGFQIAINPKYNKYKHGIASMVLKFFDKNTKDTYAHIEAGFVSGNEQLAMNYTKTLLENLRDAKHKR